MSVVDLIPALNCSVPGVVSLARMSGGMGSASFSLKTSDGRELWISCHSTLYIRMPHSISVHEWLPCSSAMYAVVSQFIPAEFREYTDQDDVLLLASDPSDLSFIVARSFTLRQLSDHDFDATVAGLCPPGIPRLT